MKLKYEASIEKVQPNDQSMWIGNDSTIFDHVADSEYFNKEIYFFPSNPNEKIWLWVLGHEQSTPRKAIIDRLWSTRWVFHVCVGGKGYYDGRVISRGTCFLSWPYFRHSIVSDPDDPFEIYWLILRGKELENFVRNSGFRNTEMVFETDCVDEIKTLFDIGIAMNYAKVNIYEYTMSLVKMIFSCCQITDPHDVKYNDSIGGVRNYSGMAKQFLRDSNYSLTISELSRKIGLSTDYLSRVFRQETGEPLKQYIIRKRFELAGIFLKKGMPPNEVARVIGYVEYSSFYHMFVSKYQITPLQYMHRESKKTETIE